MAIDALGYYYFNGLAWKKMLRDSSVPFGSIISSLKAADHDGWVKLDGRALDLTNFSQTQLDQASLLGLVATLPDATDAVLSQTSNAIGTISGSNTAMIAQNQLPDVHYIGQIWGLGRLITGEVAASGFTSVSYPNSFRGMINSVASNSNDRGFNFDIALNGDVTQQALDITPRKLSVNTFLYLGN